MSSNTVSWKELWGFGEEVGFVIINVNFILKDFSYKCFILQVKCCTNEKEIIIKQSLALAT